MFSAFPIPRHKHIPTEVTDKSGAEDAGIKPGDIEQIVRESRERR